MLHQDFQTDQTSSTGQFVRRHSYQELEAVHNKSLEGDSFTIEDDLEAAMKQALVSEDATELYDFGLQVMGFGEVMLQQRKYQEAYELYISALEK